MVTWYTPDDIADDWKDAPDDNQPYLQQMLDVAQEAVLTYANTAKDGYDPDAPGHPVPAKYRQAQLMIVLSLWTSSNQSPSGDFDGEGWGLTLSIPALTSAVKQVLRPRSVFGGPVG